MIELIILWKLCTAIGQIVEAKGHSKTNYIVMTVLLWVFAELAGGFVGAVIGIIIWGEDNGTILGYGAALVCAALSAGLSYFIAKRLPDKTQIASPASAFDPIPRP